MAGRSRGLVQPGLLQVGDPGTTSGGGGGGGGVSSVGFALPLKNTGSGTNVVAEIDPATSLAAGSMSAADKAKLDGVGAGASLVSFGFTAPLSNGGTATAPVAQIAAATTGAAGSMSAADKTKLDGLGAGASIVSLGVTAPMKNTGTATAPVVAVDNSGTTNGRAILPLQIYRQTVLAGTSVPTITIAAGAYKQIQILVRVTGGCQSGAAAFLRFNSLSGASDYLQAGFAIQGTAFVQFPTAGTANQIAFCVSGVASPITCMDSVVWFNPLAVSGVQRGVFCDTWIKENSGNAILPFKNFATVQSAADITTIDVTFGVAATGEVEARALPA